MKFTEVIEETHDWTLGLEAEGYAVLRDGERYDYIPFEQIHIFVDDDTLLASYMAGEYAYCTDALPPEVT